MPLFSKRKPSRNVSVPAPYGRGDALGSRADAARSGRRPGRLNLAAAAGSLPLTAPPAPSTTGSELLRRYRPLETLATGGFGRVEICLDPKLQRRVAIKRMPIASEYGRPSTQTTAAALAEARTASMLQHPNIVSVIDFGCSSSNAYLVMEYIDGMSLQGFLDQVEGRSLTYDEAACIADALVQALAHAHENGVLHLDIKPANVLIDRSGHVKLADFGMATLTSAAGFGGARGGTVGYMPPEQLRGDEVDERTDIFSLAAVMYESLLADAPFRAGTPAESLKRIESGVPRPSGLLPDIPQSAEDALVTALSPDPDDRMSDVQVFGDMFTAGLGNPREGRKSLARMIAALTSDEEGGEDGGEDERARRVQKIDPGKGYLGSRCDHARRVATGLVAGASAGCISWSVLGGLGTVDGMGRAAVAAGIGMAAGIAPQIGSALAGAGLLSLLAGSMPALGALPVAIACLAAGCAWWYVWGRREPGASAAFVLAAALACLAPTGAAASAAAGFLAALAPAVTAAVAACLLGPGAAAASTAGGLLFGALLSAALANGGALGAAQAAAALATPRALLPGAAATGLAAVASRLLDASWQRMRDSRGSALTIAVYLLFPLACALFPLLAAPMEITGIPVPTLLGAAGAGCLSSIISFIYVYLLGYARDRSEGDRS